MDFLKWLKNLFIVEEITTSKPGLFDEKDERNFGSSIVYSPTKNDLPTESFIVYEPKLKDQYDSDFCVGFSMSYVREATERRQTSGEFIFALCKKATGTISGFGTSILRACRVATGSGIAPYEMYRLTGNGQRDKLANWNNIPAMAYEYAKQHKAQSYFEIEKGNGLDWHDTFKAYLNHFKNIGLLIATGVDAHAVTLIGWNKDTDEIIAKDSYDRKAMNYRIGRYEPGTGRRYFKRSETAQLFTSYMLLDMPREVAEILNDYNSKAVKGSGNEVYLVKDGHKRHIQDEETAWVNLIALWYDVETITDDELEKIPTGEPMRFEEAPEKMKKLLNEIVNSPKILERIKK